MKKRLDRVVDQVKRVVIGKEPALRMSLCCLIAKGHLLIEDLPGMGKTTLARTLAKVLGMDVRRIQFTSDLLPADILGCSIFDKQSQQFVFRPGPIFGQMVLADEINRAPPKTQSALLEAMEEGQASIDGTTYAMPHPFFVIATQNPHHLVGTYPLPESQLDRFLIRIDLGFPDRETEREMLTGVNRRDLINDLEPAMSPADLSAMQEEAAKVHVSQALTNYLLDLVNHSRCMADGGSGLSPRAGMFLCRASQAWAFMEGREMVMPEDVQAVFPGVAIHRLRSGTVASGMAMVEQILKAVPVP
ncbi:MAG: MoxR family ATPase [Verrucomicrobiae bacterium]|nr:MoxR family ATPase [Verrucomicrobiae bacterium]